jgi:hypothetical protein
MSKTDLPAPRKTWLAPTKKWFASVLKSWEITGEDLDLLEATAERLNSYWRCQRVLDSEGLTIETAGGLRRHPLCEVQKSCWQGFLQGLKALDLQESTDKKKPGRPIGSGLRQF